MYRNVHFVLLRFLEVSTCTLHIHVFIHFFFSQIAIMEYGTYWFFGGVCTASTLFCLLVVPETKGKTVQEIAAYFGGPTVSQDKKSTNEERKAEAAV